MAACNASKIKRLLLVLIFGSVLALLIQNVISRRNNVVDLKEALLSEKTDRKYTPVVAKVPGIVVPDEEAMINQMDNIGEVPPVPPNIINNISAVPPLPQNINNNIGAVPPLQPNIINNIGPVPPVPLNINNNIGPVPPNMNSVSLKDVINMANDVGMDNISPQDRQLLLKMLQDATLAQLHGQTFQGQGYPGLPNDQQLRQMLNANGQSINNESPNVGNYVMQNAQKPLQYVQSVSNSVNGPAQNGSLNLLKGLIDNSVQNSPNNIPYNGNNSPLSDSRDYSGMPMMQMPGTFNFPQYPAAPTPVIPDPINDANTGPETTVLNWDGQQWMQLHQFCMGNKGNLKRTLLKSPAGRAIIYIHDLKDDKWVSGALQRDGLWDLGDVQAMIAQLQMDPDIGFIDIGSHVGTFSLVAALLGRRVVAVDPLYKNVVRLCKSTQANNFTSQITVIYTAISNDHKRVSFNLDVGNVGGTRIQAVPNGTVTDARDPNFINTVLLDDITAHIPFKKAFIKMDVEEHEFEVITSGQAFFQVIDVRGILMEWMWQKKGKHGLQLRDYLVGLRFKPFFPNGRSELLLNRYQMWPNDVLWKKMD